MSEKNANGIAPKQAGKKKNPQAGFSQVMDKALGSIKDKLALIDKKRLLMMNVPYMIVFYLADELA